MAYKFSRFCRNIIKSKSFTELYDNVTLSSSSQSVEDWGIEGHIGHSQWAGILSGLAGTGGNLIVLDDFFKNREEAESETIREKAWAAFTNDLLTRAAPTAIVIVLATPWHIDDIFGRITENINNDENFHKFKEIKFPAFDESYQDGILFPERFKKIWYLSHKAALGSYGTASLLQCNPQHKDISPIRVENVKILNEEDWPKDLKCVRAWDLASSSKEKQKSDPDYTIGVKGSVIFEPTALKNVKVPILYIEDVIRGKWEGPKRNKIIRDTAISDGTIKVGIEAFGAYKDAYTIIKDVLKGIRVVKKMQLPGDKLAKADPLEPLFESGNVYLKKAPWNEPYLACLKEFPNGKHDDDVDATAILYHMFAKESLQIFTTKMLEDEIEEKKKENKSIENTKREIKIPFV